MIIEVLGKIEVLGLDPPSTNARHITFLLTGNIEFAPYIFQETSFPGKTSSIVGTEGPVAVVEMVEELKHALNGATALMLLIFDRSKTRNHSHKVGLLVCVASIPSGKIAKI
ncbi:unnamed protein product [Fraxinus pennsylvanica]|uniref:Uncharacterized protein n=1 Tax=Fraxinus pennsylvanica TaxID=56036 RepID=A0AAD1ZJL8_9LAMI|nr:unnamed protein product [Fraxinus pennsylvanica]